MSARFTIASLVLVVALSGCNDSHGESLPLDALGTQYAETVCGAFEDCYGPDLVETLIGGDCRTRFGTTFDEGVVPQLEEAVADGSVIYDGTRARACFDDLAALGCGVLASRLTSPACDAAIQGTVAPGGACSITSQCMGDAFCMLSGACPGTCQARGASGATCTEDEACQTGLTCQEGTCRAPAAAGASCGGSTGVGCSAGTVCLGGTMGGAGTCRPVEEAFAAPLDSACDPQAGTLCQPGLSCAVTSFMPPSVTFACVGEAPAGGACAYAIPDQCPSGQACDAQIALGRVMGTCQPLPTDGSPCAAGRCAEGHRCEGTTCRRISSVGGACETDADCYSGNCDGTTCAEGMLCGG